MSDGFIFGNKKARHGFFKRNSVRASLPLAFHGEDSFSRVNVLLLYTKQKHCQKYNSMNYIYFVVFRYFFRPDFALFWGA